MSGKITNGSRSRAGAKHLGKGIIERDIEVQVPDKTTEVILYAAALPLRPAANALQQMGYTNATQWPAAGKPGKTSALQSKAINRPARVFRPPR